jgi:DNA-directed RNA polymerase specialized sigma24 family protein
MLEGEIDDATQEVFVECLKTGGALERADADRGDFRGLLFGVTRNVARRFEQRAAVRGRVLPEDSAWLQHVADDEPGQATLFDRTWAQALIRQTKRMHRERALADGPAGARRIELLERRFGGDEAIREIAAQWGVPAQDVHNAYRKARTEFYGCLREVVAFHAPAGAELDSECRRLLTRLR